jgi:hypothetical protein
MADPCPKYLDAEGDHGCASEAGVRDHDAGVRALLVEAELFFDFSVSDPARYQLMNQNVLHDFHPSDAAYQVAINAYDRAQYALYAQGVNPSSQSDLDLWTALLVGAINQQLVNDVGGTRWRRQLPRIVDMFCDEVGIAGPSLRRKK